VVRRLAVAVLLLVIAMGSTLAQQDVTLSVLPSAESVDAGDMVYVEISVDSQVDVYAAQYFLGFDTSAFEAFSQEQGEYLSSDGSSTSTIANSYDNTEGYTTYGETRVSTTTGVSGNGILSTITLKVKDNAPTGDYVLYLYDVVLADPGAEQIESVGTVSGEVYVNGTEQPQTQQSPTSWESPSSQATPTETPTSTAVGTETPEPTKISSESSQTSTSSSSALPESTPAPTAVLAVLALLGAFFITRRR